MSCNGFEVGSGPTRAGLGVEVKFIILSNAHISIGKSDLYPKTCVFKFID